MKYYIGDLHNGTIATAESESEALEIYHQIAFEIAMNECIMHRDDEDSGFDLALSDALSFHYVQDENGNLITKISDDANGMA